MKLENHYFASLTETTALGNDHQWLLKPLSEDWRKLYGGGWC